MVEPAKPPFPQNRCEACERGEKLVISPFRIGAQQAAIHSPSTNVCMKYIKPSVFEKLRKLRRIS
jgi:hypothetical protein